MDERRHLVLMGVTGTGKSTIGAGVAEQLGYRFTDGDDFHPPANMAKMSRGEPLDDEDRWPWLQRIAEWTIEERAAGRSSVIACSALKHAYRDVLRGAAPDTFFVHLVGDPALLRERMTHRAGHFMPQSLLDSQLATLEPLAADENGMVVDVAAPVSACVADIVARVHRME